LRRRSLIARTECAPDVLLHRRHAIHIHRDSPLAGFMHVVSDWRDAEVERAPICSYCGVTTLPADLSNVIDTRFICENPDCEAFGETV
jgi:hypothetical protein